MVGVSLTESEKLQSVGAGSEPHAVRAAEVLAYGPHIA